MTKEEVTGGVDKALWFVAYSHALQRVGEATCGQKWKWSVGRMPEVRVSPLVHAFWEETGAEFSTACVKLCLEPPLRSIFQKIEAR